MGGVPIILGVSEVPTEVPLLGSRRVFEDLDMQLDTRSRKASFLSIGVTASSHLAIRLDRFPEDEFPA